MEKFLFGLSPEMILLLLFILFIIIFLLIKRDTKSIAALAAAVPLFWLFSKKFGGSNKELEMIRAEYDEKLKNLQHEFDNKLNSIKTDLQKELTQHKLKAESTKKEILEVDAASKEFLDKASPNELEELARGLLSITQ